MVVCSVTCGSSPDEQISIGWLSSCTSKHVEKKKETGQVIKRSLDVNPALIIQETYL